MQSKSVYCLMECQQNKQLLVSDGEEHYAQGFIYRSKSRLRPCTKEYLRKMLYTSLIALALSMLCNLIVLLVVPRRTNRSGPCESSLTNYGMLLNLH